MPDPDYTRFRDDLIVEIAEISSAHSPVNLNKLWREKFANTSYDYDWVKKAGPDMMENGWGTVRNSGPTLGFIINGEGLAVADNIRESRRKKSFKEKIRAIPRSDWIALLAVLISLIALFK